MPILTRKDFLEATQDEEGVVSTEMVRVISLIADTFAKGKDPERVFDLRSPLCKLALELCMGMAME